MSSIAAYGQASSKVTMVQLTMHGGQTAGYCPACIHELRHGTPRWVPVHTLQCCVVAIHHVQIEIHLSTPTTPRALFPRRVDIVSYPIILHGSAVAAS